MMREPTLDALVSSRICHDLISPVGAIGNGVELLAELAASMPEVGLISESVDTATNKLRFFRICFGQSSVGAMSAVADVQAVADAMIGTSRLALHWQITQTDMPREDVKLLFLALLCVETVLPVGGEITVALNGDRFQISAKGKRIQLSSAWAVLRPEPYTKAITPARVQFPLVVTIAKKLGRTLLMSSTETELTLTF